MKVEITEVVLRDGFQDEPVFVETDSKISIAEMLVNAGFMKIEATSFVSPKKVPQMADADDVVPRLPRGPRPIVYNALVLNSRGIERAVQSGIDEIAITVSASIEHSRANAGSTPNQILERLATTVAEHPGSRFMAGVATAFVCPFEGEIPVSRVIDVVQAFYDMGIRRINLADTLGVATTEHVLAGTSAVREAFPDVAMGLHLHNATNQAFETALRAVKEIEIKHFDSALAGFGGCPFAPGAHGNLATEELVRIFHENDIDTGTDLAKLRTAAAEVREIVASARPLVLA